MHCHPDTMCFSSSIICLLVVTYHGTFVNAYASETGFPNKTSGPTDAYISNTNFTNSYNSPGVQYPIQSSHLSKENIIKEEENKISLELHRRKRSSDDIMLPLPKPIEGNKDVSSRQASSIVHNRASHLHQVNGTGDNLEAHGHHDHHGHGQDDHHDHDDHGHDHHVHDKISLPTSNERIDKASDPSQAHGQIASVSPCTDADHKHRNGDAEHDHEPSADFHQHYSSNNQSISGKVWLYASLAVVVISLCGLISVAVIPIMQKWFYHTLLQFLVGLAVGSLSGDGLLHLMPHAILDGEMSHDHSKDGQPHASGPSMQSMEMKAIWRGLAALSGIFLFFIAERLLGAITAYRRLQNESKLSRATKNMIGLPGEDGPTNGSVGEKLAQPKKNSYDHIRDKDEKETVQMLQADASPSKKGSTQSIHEVGFHGRSSFSIDPDVSVSYHPASDCSVVVSEHHGHSHGHTHEIPHSVSAVAWMVIMGDGLHNFCDGLAIGAAFASGEADGISTTVAVFCHELPHELGDFAMLLKTGMKVKEALFYNGLSSVLCFIGMVIGVSLGNVHSATNWVFAGTAGMFLYIALVDMLPELSSPTNTPNKVAFSTLVVQVLGISIGISIMLLIALYEHELHSIVS